MIALRALRAAPDSYESLVIYLGSERGSTGGPTSETAPRAERDGDGVQEENLGRNTGIFGQREQSTLTVLGIPSKVKQGDFPRKRAQGKG